MREGRSLTRLLSWALVVAVAAGSTSALVGVAHAAPILNPLNTVSAEPAGGTDPADVSPTATIIALEVAPSASSAVADVTVETLTATVSPPALGSVRFMEDATDIGAAVPVWGGVASTKTTLPAGRHPLRAVFTPPDSTSFGSSTSNTVSYVVDAPIGQNATVTTLRVFPTPAFPGVPVVLLANIAPVGAAGTIQFMDGESALDAPVPATAGFTLLITPLSKGKHSLTAVFTPTNQSVFVPSASPPVVLTVAPQF